MPSELAWDHAVQDIPEDGLTVERSASPEELEALASALDLISCKSLLVRYRLTPRSGGHFHLSGTLKAQVEQSCVVTLEPFLNEVAENFDVDYWPQSDVPEPSGGAVDVHDEPDLEPIVAGRIEVGNIVFQTLAGGIDLFPRKPGAAFAPPAETDSDVMSNPEGPFAALAKIKDKG